MKQEQLSRVMQGVVLTVLGVLIAIYGAGTVIDMYFAVAFIIAGSVLALLAVFLLAKKQPISFGLVFLSAALITCSIGLFTHYVSVAILIEFTVLLILALGAASLLYGVYCLAKKQPTQGVIYIAFGAVCVLLSTLYMAVENFRTAFWILTGILIAIFGVLMIIFTFIDNKGKRKK